MMQPADTSVRTIRHHSLRLGAVAAATALLTTLVYTLTDARIADQQHESERAALAAVLPNTLHDNDLLAAAFTLLPNDPDFAQPQLLGLGSARSGYRALQDGIGSGVILPLETADGYSGTIVLMIGIDADSSITGVRVVQHAETPGLGDKIDITLSPWIRSFNNRSLPNTPAVLWQVKKDGGDFDQFVGATITPRAVVAAVHNALLFFEANRELLLTEAAP
jgi:electron transport complex protein RnfG